VKRLTRPLRAIHTTYEATVVNLERAVALLERRYTPLGRFTPGPFEGWGFLWHPALIGALGWIMILVGGSFSNTPFKLNMAHTWFFGEPLSAPNAPSSQTELLLAIVFTYGGILLVMRVWLRLAEVVKLHRGATVRSLWWTLLVWCAPMLIAPPMFSRDVFSYAAQGEMTAHNLSPYLYGPFTLGAGPYVNPVDPLWGNTPAPYGPMFLWADGLIDRIARHNQLATVVGLRLLEFAALLLAGYAVMLAAKALHRDPSEAFVLAILNPLVILTLVAGAHNDALMTALLVLGVALALRRRLWWALALCASAAAVKAPAVLGVAFIAWHWRGPDAPWRRRWRPVLDAIVITVLVMGLWTGLAGFGLGWTKNLAAGNTVRSWAAPATGLGMAIHAWLRDAGVTTSLTHDLTITRGIGLALAGASTIALFFTGARRGWVRSLAVALIVIVVLSPTVQPWYFVWGLMLLAVSYRGREHFWLLLLSVVGPFIGLPGGRTLFAGLARANPLLIALAVALLGGVLLVPMGRWTQWSWPGPAEPDVQA
jgi:hypothetical protein